VYPRLAAADTGLQAAAVPQTGAAARMLGLTLDVIEVQLTDDVDKALATLAGNRAGALVVYGDVRTYIRREQIAAFAIKHRLPTASSPKEMAQAGLLLSYGANQADLYRRSAGYVDKILRGAKPGDLPIELPTKFDMVINLKTAKAIGITILQSLPLRADEVIQ
jgi:putative tryptophan/tyrosine transport system substrate-binding protein